MSNEKTSDFLRYFEQASECGALIVARERYDQALSAASDGGYCVTELYETAIAVLEGGKSVALRVDGELSKELYDLVRQYNHRRGLVQVVSREDLTPRLVQLNPAESRLLMVIPAEHEAKNVTRYPELFDLLGMVERA